MTRGKWEGIVWGRREGFSGTTIKEIWAKPRGGVEAREGGGDGWGLTEGSGGR